MRARNKVVGAIGASVGLILAATAASVPASAAPAPAPVAASFSCASFEGLTVKAPSVSYSGVGLGAGETITVTVSPAAAGDQIMNYASVGFALVMAAGPATQPYAFTSGSSTLYNLTWSYAGPDYSVSSLERTWTFDCSTASAALAPPVTTTTADDDRDGVVNSADSCSGTTLPDNVSRKAAGSYYANAAKSFVDGTGRPANITVADAGGCSAAQISKALGLSKNSSRSGISLATLTSWASSH